MEPPLSDLGVTCGGCKSKLQAGLLRCTRCRAGFNYGQEGIREVLKQAKRSFVMAEKEDNEYARWQGGRGVCQERVHKVTRCLWWLVA